MNFVDDSKVKTAKIVQMEFKSWLNSSDNNQTNWRNIYIDIPLVLAFDIFDTNSTPSQEETCLEQWGKSNLKSFL